MTEENIADLRAARRGDQEASERLVERNTGLIWSVARRFFGRGVDPEDLYQLGCVGFLKAIVGLTKATVPSFPPMPCPKFPGRFADFSGTTAR